jgi:DNA-binding transcriptional MerR regulator
MRRLNSEKAALNKAPDAFRTISEVADELDLPQHVLRFWESRFPHIKPLKRGGGRRYYRPDDIDLLRGIRRLLYADGYTIRGVQRILREQGVRTVQLVGQGQDVPNLATMTPDGDDDRRNSNGGLAEVNFRTPPDLCAPDNAERDGGGPQAHAPVRPQNGPIADANVAAIHLSAMTPAARQEPVLVDQVLVDQARGVAAPVAAAPVAVTPAAVTPVNVTPVAVTPAAVVPAGAPPAGVKAGGVKAADVKAAAVTKPSPPPLLQQQPSLAHSSPAYLAAQDLDRLKRALAELEACRRLLDKAHEGGR